MEDQKVIQISNRNQIEDYALIANENTNLNINTNKQNVNDMQNGYDFQNINVKQIFEKIVDNTNNFIQNIKQKANDIQNKINPQNVNDKQNVNDLQNGNNIQNVNDLQNGNNIQNVNDLQNGKDIQNVYDLQNGNDIQNVNDLQNGNNIQNVIIVNENVSKNENENKRQDIYSRFFKLLCMVIECIFCIAFIVFEKAIKNLGDNLDIFKAHYSGIATISAFFFVFFILFIFEIVGFCVCKNNCSTFGIILFWLSQVFYFIDLFMIPSYYSILIYDDKIKVKEFSNIKKGYIKLIIISQIFSLFIIFFDFIIINLYKDLCCQMDEICDKTFAFLNNFGQCIKDIISRVICQSKNEEDEEIKKIVQLSEEQKVQMNKLNEEIKHLLSQHINLVVDSYIK
jgi:hypothetical protein